MKNKQEKSINKKLMPIYIGMYFVGMLAFTLMNGFVIGEMVALPSMMGVIMCGFLSLVCIIKA